MNETVVTGDRRVEDLRVKLWDVDFGANLDGFQRTRIAQVILAILDADREETARALKREVKLTYSSFMTDRERASNDRAEQWVREATERVRAYRYAPEISARDLWKAGQPTKAWVATP